MPGESCIPVIPSANLQKSLHLWIDGLGFSVSSEMREGDKLISACFGKTTYGLCLTNAPGLRSSRKTTKAFDSTGGRRIYRKPEND